MQDAGIAVQPNVAAYADQRSEWNPIIRRVASALEYDADEIEGRARPIDAAAPSRASGLEPMMSHQHGARTQAIT